MKHRLVIDVETASTIDLPAAGADRYAEDQTTRVLCVGYQLDQDAPCIWIPGQLVPDFTQVDVFVAHNVAFEIAIWKHCLKPLGWGDVPDLEHWSCTMARASYHGLPAALDDVAIALKFPPHMRKDEAGRRIMLQLMKPRATWPGLRWWHESDPVKYHALQRYCVRDVEIEAALDRMLPELPADEAELWRINQAMNDRGVHLDTDLMGRLAHIVRREMARLNDELALITGGLLPSVNAVRQILGFLARAEGVQLATLDRDAVAEALASNPFLTPLAERILRIRAEAAKTSTAKITAMARSISRDGRARGLFRYYGASRTGRYSSQRIQLQNLARPTIKDVDTAVAMIKQGADGHALNLLFSDTAMGVVSSCLRGCLTARPGHLLAVADLAQIEARVIAWLARQDDVLSVFGSGEDVYVWTARQVGSSDRQLGKVMVLALGFGMGAKRFIETAAKWGIDISLERASDLVRDWRDANQEIVRFWWNLEAAALRVAGAPHGYREDVGVLTLTRRRRAMVIRLPSGRELFYQFVKREWVKTRNGAQRLQLVYEGTNQITRRWELLRAWPGKLAENVTQAVARDVLTSGKRKLYLDGLNFIGTVHDELIAEAPLEEAGDTLQAMLAVMRCAPDWARGLPVDAEGWTGERYRK